MWFSLSLPCSGFLEIWEPVDVNFFPIKFEEISSNSSLLYSYRIPTIHMLDYVILSLTCHWGSVNFFQFFFSLRASVWIVYIDLFSSSWIFSSIVPKLLLGPSNPIFHLDTVFFSSGISIWLFFKFPCLYWNSYLLAHYAWMGLYLLTFSLFDIIHTALHV